MLANACYRETNSMRLNVLSPFWCLAMRDGIVAQAVAAQKGAHMAL